MVPSPVMKFTWRPAASRCSWVSGNPTLVAITVGAFATMPCQNSTGKSNLKKKRLAYTITGRSGTASLRSAKKPDRVLHRRRLPQRQAHERGGGAELLGRAHLPDHLARAERGGPAPHRHPPRDRADDRVVERDLLVPQQRRAFAGRAAQTDRGGTVVDHLVGEAGRLVEVERVGIGQVLTVGLERARRQREQAGDIGCTQHVRVPSSGVDRRGVPDAALAT